MRYILLLFLVVFFIYALALVIFNHSAIEVHLIFTQVPAMNLGLLLIISIFLGFCIGIITSVLLFKVLQRQLELTRLKKINSSLTAKIDEITTKINTLTHDKSTLEKMMTSNHTQPIKTKNTL